MKEKTELTPSPRQEWIYSVAHRERHAWQTFICTRVEKKISDYFV